jgi:hypothetical protein
MRSRKAGNGQSQKTWASLGIYKNKQVSWQLGDSALSSLGEMHSVAFCGGGVEVL